MKAVLQYRASPGFRRQINAAAPAWLDVVVVEEADKEQFVKEMTDADVLLHVLEQVTADVIANAPRLRLIQKIGVGVNTIDLHTARAQDIAVCNMPGTNSQAVAEMTLTLMQRSARVTSLSGSAWETACITCRQNSLVVNSSALRSRALSSTIQP